MSDSDLRKKALKVPPHMRNMRNMKRPRVGLGGMKANQMQMSYANLNAIRKHQEKKVEKKGIESMKDRLKKSLEYGRKLTVEKANVEKQLQRARLVCEKMAQKLEAVRETLKESHATNERLVEEVRMLRNQQSYHEVEQNEVTEMKNQVKHILEENERLIHSNSELRKLIKEQKEALKEMKLSKSKMESRVTQFKRYEVQYNKEKNEKQKLLEDLERLSESKESVEREAATNDHLVRKLKKKTKDMEQEFNLRLQVIKNNFSISLDSMRMTLTGLKRSFVNERERIKEEVEEQVNDIIEQIQTTSDEDRTHFVDDDDEEIIEERKERDRLKFQEIQIEVETLREEKKELKKIIEVTKEKHEQEKKELKEEIIKQVEQQQIIIQQQQEQLPLEEIKPLEEEKEVIPEPEPVKEEEKEEEIVVVEEVKPPKYAPIQNEQEIVDWVEHFLSPCYIEKKRTSSIENLLFDHIQNILPFKKQKEKEQKEQKEEEQSSTSASSSSSSSSSPSLLNEIQDKFKSGFLFCAFIRMFQPKLLDYEVEVDLEEGESASLNNCELSFKLFEEVFGVERTLAPDFSDADVEFPHYLEAVYHSMKKSVDQQKSIFKREVKEMEKALGRLSKFNKRLKKQSELDELIAKKRSYMKKWNELLIRYKQFCGFYHSCENFKKWFRNCSIVSKLHDLSLFIIEKRSSLSEHQDDDDENEMKIDHETETLFEKCTNKSEEYFIWSKETQTHFLEKDVDISYGGEEKENTFREDFEDSRETQLEKDQQFQKGNDLKRDLMRIFYQLKEKLSEKELNKQLFYTEEQIELENEVLMFSLRGIKHMRVKQIEKLMLA